MPKPDSFTHVQEEDTELNVFYEFPRLREIYKNIQIARGEIDLDEEDLAPRNNYYDDDDDEVGNDNGDDNPSMIPLAFMDVNDLVVRKSNPNIYGVVMVVGWNLDDDDRDEYEDDFPAPRNNEVQVLWGDEDVPENVPFEELEIKDRSFSLGEQVVKSSDPAGAIGYVTNAELFYDLRFPDGHERREVPSWELWPVNPYIPGTYLSYNGCLGAVRRVHATLVIELSDRSVCTVGPLVVGVSESEEESEDDNPEWITALNAAGLPDESNYVSNEQYYPSLGVIIDTSYLRNEARFVRGAFKRNVERGRVLRVIPEKIDVEWLEKRMDRSTMPQPTIAVRLNPTLLSWNFRSSWQYKDHVLTAPPQFRPKEGDTYCEGNGFNALPANVWKIYVQNANSTGREIIRDDSPRTAEIIGIHSKYMVKWADSSMTLEESKDIVAPLEYRMDEIMPDDTVYREDDGGKIYVGIVTTYDPVDKLASVNWHKIPPRENKRPKEEENDDDDEEVDKEEEEEEDDEDDEYEIEKEYPFDRSEAGVPMFSIYRGEDDDPNGVHVGSLVRRIPANPKRLTAKEKEAWYGEVLGIRNGLANVLWENGVRENVNPFSLIELYGNSDDEDEDEDEDDFNGEVGEGEDDEEDDGEDIGYDEDELSAGDDDYNGDINGDSGGNVIGDAGDDEEDISVNKLSKLSGILYSGFYKTNSDSLSKSSQLNEDNNDNNDIEIVKEANDDNIDDDDDDDDEDDDNESFQVIDDDIPNNSILFESHKDATPNRDLSKRIVKEWKILKSGKLDGVWVRAYSQNVQFMSFMIAGPEDTPYENGIFLFDVYFPLLYPIVPPEVFYRSVTPRLHPNLYEDGKVCLSLLGTWTSLSTNEGWQPSVSNILQVILSIQGLILGTAEPFYNEAWYESVKESQYKGTSESELYNETVALRSLNGILYYTGVIVTSEGAKGPSELFPFDDVAKKFFNEKRKSILDQCRTWMMPPPTQNQQQSQNESSQKKKKTCSVFVSWPKGYSAAVKALYPKLEESLSLLE